MAKAGIKGVIEGGQQAPQEAPERDLTRWTCSPSKSTRGAYRVPPFQSPKRSKGALTQTSFAVLKRPRLPTECIQNSGKGVGQVACWIHKTGKPVSCSTTGPNPLRYSGSVCTALAQGEPRDPKAEQSKIVSDGPPGRSPRGRRLGEKHPSHQPGALGSFLGVKAKPLRGRCASLDPHPSDSAPQAPARASGAFFSEGRVKGLVRPAAP